MELLRIINKTREITNEQLKDFYHVNDEQLVEKLIDFLEHEVSSFPFYAYHAKPKYLHNTLLRIQDIYDKLLSEGKNHPPYHFRYQELQKEIYNISHYYESYAEEDQLTIPEKIYLKIFFDQNLEASNQAISEHPLLLQGNVQGKKLLDHILEKYFEVLTTEYNSEYEYMYALFKNILKETSIYPDMQQYIYEFYQSHLEDIKNNADKKYQKYRYQALGILMTGVNMQCFEAKDRVKYHFPQEEKEYQDEFIFTIDDVNTSLREDAISMKEQDGNLYVNLYIVDAVDIFEQHKKLSQQARGNWFTGKQEMLSQESKKKLFSLNAQPEEMATKKVIVYELKFDKNNCLTDIAIRRGTAKISHNYSYEQVNRMMELGNRSYIKTWERLYQIMNQYHINNTSQKKYHLVKELLHYIETGKPYHNTSRSKAHLMISELKVLINFYQAKLCGENEIPMMYRLNDLDISDKELEYIKKCCNDYEEQEYVINILDMLPMFSYYRMKNTGHKGLGFQYYAHCTTPARNYFAYINQHILTSIILDKHFELIEPFNVKLKEQEELQIQKERQSRQQKNIELRKKSYQINGVSYLDEMKKIEKLLKQGEMTAQQIKKSISLPEKELNLVLEFMVDALHLEKKDGYFKLLVGEDMKVGIYKEGKGSFGLVELENGGHILIPSRFVKGANNKDRVLVKIHHEKKEILGEIMKHKCILEQATAVVTEENGKLYAVLDKDRDSNLILLTDTMNAKIDDKVMISFDRNADLPTAKVIKVYGNVYNPRVLVDQILDEHHIPNEFPKNVLQEADKIPDRVLQSELKRRLDLRNKQIFTIDGDDAKDFDDAVSIDILENGNYQLGVHIADVSYYVKEDSDLDIEADKRGTSVYVADRVVPMLPEKLSNGICSLNPNQNRLTLSCIMEIDKQGNIVDYDFYESVICSNKRMTYREVNEVFEGKDVKGYEPFKDSLEKMLELSHLLRKQRQNRGAISFEIPKPKYILDEDGRAIDVTVTERKEGEKLIEDFMISANECAATMMEELDHPFQYRVHPKPDPYHIKNALETIEKMGYHYQINLEDGVEPGQIMQLLEQLEGDENYATIAYLFLRAMNKAFYSGENLHHFALASNNYSHFTSPIRRYPDLLAHRAIKLEKENKYNQKKAFQIEKKLNKKLMHSSNQEVNAQECERDVDRLKAIEYLEDYISEIFDARIIMIDPFGIRIQLDNCIQGFITRDKLKDYDYAPDGLTYYHKTKNTSLRIGQRIKCRLDDVSYQDFTAEFSLYQPQKIKKK